MAFTAVLGTASSRLGNIVLGLPGQSPAAPPTMGWGSDASEIASAVGKDLRNRGKAAVIAALGYEDSAWDPQPPIVPTMGWGSDPSEIASAVGKDLRERNKAAMIVALGLLEAEDPWDVQPFIVPAFLYAESPIVAPLTRRRQALMRRRTAAAELLGLSYDLLFGFPAHIDLVVESMLSAGHWRGGY